MTKPIAAFLFLVPSCNAVQADTYDVYLLAGQSNMDGRGQASDHNVTLVDLRELLKTTPRWMSPDGVHPSPVGNQMIAQHVAEAINRLLRSDQRTARQP